MATGRTFADLVGDYLDGNLAGQRMVADLRSGTVDPDLIYHCVCERKPGLEGDYLRGFLRSLQKVLEVEVRHG